MLIDKKGRVLGRWNAIDAAVTLVMALVVACGVVAGAKWLVRVMKPVPPVAVDVDIQLAGPATPPTGAQVMGRDGRPAGQIIDLFQLSPARLTVKYNAPYKPTGAVKLDGLWRSAGSPVTVRTQAGEVLGTITEIRVLPHRFVRAVVRFPSISRQAAARLKAGDYQANGSGRIEARIVSKGGIKPAAADPSRLELQVPIDLWVGDQGGKLIYQGRPLVVGEEIPFRTSHYNINYTLCGEATRCGEVLEIATLKGELLLQ